MILSFKNSFSQDQSGNEAVVSDILRLLINTNSFTMF